MNEPAVTLRERMELALGIDPVAKPKVYRLVFESTRLANLNYWLELLLAAGIATLGLVLNSPAVVIGAMVVSPLMGPILAAGLALAAADVYLGIKSGLMLALSIVASIAFSAGLEWLLPFHTPTSEILARTQPNLLDLGVAVFSGLAGSLVVSRGSSGGSSALPGVAIAVALMPPLCTVGFGIGSGWNWNIMSGAMLLFLTNLTAISASAFLVFYLVRMDAPEARAELEISERELAAQDFLYSLLSRTALGSYMGDLGHLRWRVAMLAVVFLMLFVPLGRSLVQLRDESISRSAIRQAVDRRIATDQILSEQVAVFDERIVLRLVTTSAVDPALAQEIEKEIIRRTGKSLEMSIREVASGEELALLRERIRRPAVPAPPPLPELSGIGSELLGRVKAPLEEVWPANSAELVSYGIGFEPDSVVLRIRYRANRPLEAAIEEVLAKTMKSRLRVENLRLLLERDVPRQGRRNQ